MCVLISEEHYNYDEYIQLQYTMYSYGLIVFTKFVSKYKTFVGL